MEPKKIGLAVVTYKDNFGSALQTFATQYIVSSMGFNVECITTSGIQNIINSKKKRYYAMRIFNKDEFAYIRAVASSIFRRKIKNASYANNVGIRHEKYINFNNRYLRFSPYTSNFAELTQLSKKYDAVIVGSDQLWRPSNIAGCFFTLEFLPKDIRKIAYSTSFGVANLHKSIQKHAKEFLKSFDYISVRENSGKTIVKKLLNKDIPVVCDPTMLLTIHDWDQYVDHEPFIKGDYILCYIMGQSNVQRNFVKRLRIATGYKVVGLLHGSTYVAGDDEWVDTAPYNVGPFDFINLIKHAKFVCTDSFHCSVFSIINHTPFFVFRRDNDNMETSANDRIYTLLSWSGLDNRLLYGNENIDECLKLTIDFDAVNEKVSVRRSDSLEYLETSLHTLIE